MICIVVIITIVIVIIIINDTVIEHDENAMTAKMNAHVCWQWSHLVVDANVVLLFPCVCVCVCVCVCAG